jgi:hypothetical protein
MTTKKSPAYLDNPHCQAYDETIQHLEDRWRERTDRTVAAEKQLREEIDAAIHAETKARDRLLAADGYRVVEGFTSNGAWAMDVRPLYLSEIVAGAIYDFMGYLTTREKPIIIDAGQPVSDLMAAFEAWANERKLPLDDAAVEYWSAHVQKVDAVRGR